MWIWKRNLFKSQNDCTNFFCLYIMYTNWWRTILIKDKLQVSSSPIYIMDTGDVYKWWRTILYVVLRSLLRCLLRMIHKNLGCFGISFVVGWGSLRQILAQFRTISIIMLCRQGGSKARWSFLHLIWFTCVLVIWQGRNYMVFNHKENLMPRLLDKFKYLSLWWLKHRIANVSLEFAGW